MLEAREAIARLSPSARLPTAPTFQGGGGHQATVHQTGSALPSLSVLAATELEVPSRRPIVAVAVPGVDVEGGGQVEFETQATRALILDIRSTHREREDLLRPEGDMTRRILAVCRRYCDGDRVAGQRLAKWIEAGKAEAAAVGAVLHLIAARDALRAARKERERRLQRLAKSLPVWKSWGEGVKGLGALGIGQIVGEAGDLSDYANPAKLWKRMGLAVMPDGGRQRKIAGAAALDHGYSPRRRAVMAVLGNSMVMARGDYYPLYLERKEIEVAKASAEGVERTPKHMDNRAKRYIQKRILRDLWRAWRSA